MIRKTSRWRSGMPIMLSPALFQPMPNNVAALRVYNQTMSRASETFDRFFPEMRWRALSLAADLDRVQRAGGVTDPRLNKLCDAIKVLLSDDPNRAAAQDQQSNKTPSLLDLLVIAWLKKRSDQEQPNRNRAYSPEDVRQR